MTFTKSSRGVPRSAARRCTNNVITPDNNDELTTQDELPESGETVFRNISSSSGLLNRFRRPLGMCELYRLRENRIAKAFKKLVYAL